MYAVVIFFIIQSTCAPTNDNLMELVVMVDALRQCFRRSYHRCYPLLWLCAP
ncbi:ribose-phosphate pyrophosphokinase-like domain-containing protein [Escherichia coli]